MQEIKRIEDFRADDEVKICKYLDGNQDGACICIDDVMSLCYPKSLRKKHIEDYSNIDLSEMVNERKDLFLKINTGKSCECDDCPFLHTKKMKDIDLENFAWINIANYTTCNLRCKYCYFNDEQLGAKLPKESRQLLPIIKNMSTQGLLKQNVCLAIAGGEPTLFDDIPETLEYLNENYKYARFNLQSNSTLTHKVEKLIKPLKKFKAGYKNLYTSIDAGTRETYKRIRGKDLFNELVENLLNYAKTGAFTSMQLKYILLNEEGMYNLALKDLWGYARLVAKISYFNPNKTDIIIDRNLYESGIRFSQDMLEAAVILAYVAKKLNLGICYSACGFIEQEDIELIEKLASSYPKKKKNYKEFSAYLAFNMYLKQYWVLDIFKKISKIIKKIKIFFIIN